MPFFQSDSAFHISGGSFNSFGRRVLKLDVTVHPRPHSDSQIPSNGNESNPDAPECLEMTGTVSPPVGPTLGEPLKTNDFHQLPNTGHHPAHQPQKTDDLSQTEPASHPASEEKGWVRHVHPEGWIYFFKEHDDEPRDIQLHEICGDLARSCGGLHVQIYVDDRRWYASIDKDLLFSEQLTDEKGQNHLV